MSPSNKLALKIANRVSGLKATQAEFLCDGATSRAWRVKHGNVNIIIRMVRPGTGRPVTYLSEFEIYRQLKSKRSPIPEPIATYKDVQIDGVITPWAVTKSIQGRALKSDRLTPKVAHDLGRALATIHSLPIKKYGRLEERKNGIYGQQYTPRQGILARWCWGHLWPFDETLLKRNAAYNLLACLESRILQYGDIINSIGDDENVVLVHSDLHGEHIFVQNDRLSGIIDFGAAFIGVAEWEFAKLGFHFGWGNVKHIFEAYNSKTHSGILPHRNYLIGLAFGLYKIHRYANEDAPKYKIEKGVNFIICTLDLLDNVSA